jgi:hypothetical protein
VLVVHICLTRHLDQIPLRVLRSDHIIIDKMWVIMVGICLYDTQNRLNVASSLNWSCDYLNAIAICRPIYLQY